MQKEFAMLRRFLRLRATASGEPPSRDFLHAKSLHVRAPSTQHGCESSLQQGGGVAEADCRLRLRNLKVMLITRYSMHIDRVYPSP